MKKEEIIKDVLVRNEGITLSKQMLEGTIPGASVYHHAAIAGETITFPVDGTFVRILFLCSGDASFAVAEQVYRYDEKAFVVANHLQEVCLSAHSASDVVEIRWAVFEKDMVEILSGETCYPFSGRYMDAYQYRDPFKSEKTISRAIIPQRMIPRFAMGSVETYGEDLIGQHEHPLLDQFFFSFPDNDMDLLIDDLVYPMAGDTLLYIPLGSNHGVKVNEGQVANYIWIDFIQDPDAANAYLDEVHKPTGTIRNF